MTQFVRLIFLFKVFLSLHSLWSQSSLVIYLRFELLINLFLASTVHLIHISVVMPQLSAGKLKLIKLNFLRNKLDFFRSLDHLSSIAFIWGISISLRLTNLSRTYFFVNSFLRYDPNKVDFISGLLIVTVWF